MSPPRRGRPGYDLASVLAVAVEVFNERGYDRTSMRDLADRHGVLVLGATETAEVEAALGRLQRLIRIDVEPVGMR